MTMPDTTRVLLAQVQACLHPTTHDLRALPPAAYVDPVFHALELEHVFRREWMCVGREDEFAATGDYLALDIAGEPVVVVRDGDGELRALSNVCRHRLHPLVGDGSGRVPRFTCPYHLWTYRLDGELTGAPTMAQTPGFDRAACALPRFRVETWLGFVFVNLDAAAQPLQPRLAGVEAVYANHGIADAVTVARYHAAWQGNWKLAVENGSESYHHIGLHGDSLEPCMPARGSFVRAVTDDWGLHVTPVRAGGSGEARHRHRLGLGPHAGGPLGDEGRHDLRRRIGLRRARAAEHEGGRAGGAVSLPCPRTP
jgi:phenylpropionate dioxygenase-like ring-hydroxylating dioxygenase large terminal subunit